VRSTLPSRSTSASAADVHRRSAVAARAFSTARPALSPREKRKRLRSSSGDETALLVKVFRAVYFLPCLSGHSNA
jgi:hypothetical protein